MSPEIPVTESDPKRVNWTEILRYSFMFAQGYDTHHGEIIHWLTAGPLKGQLPTEDDFKPDAVSTYARTSGTHSLGAADEDVARGYSNWFIRMSSDPETPYTIYYPPLMSGPYTEVIERKNLRHPADSLLSGDYFYLVDRMKGRPKEIQRSGRDVWSSFVVDFGILQKGTGNWTYAALPDAYKEMWESIRKELKKPEYQKRLQAVINVYLEHHPDLSSEDLKKIEQYKIS